MMKLFKIWCSLCHTECIDIYSAITSFPIFLPNQPMLMFQCVCRIQFHQGQGWGEICLKQVLLLCPLGTLLFYCHPSMANGLSAVALGIARKDQTHRWKCDKIRFLCCVESAGVSPPKPGTGVVQWCFCRAKSTREEPVWSPCGKEAAWKRTGFFTGQKYHPLPRFAFYMPAFGRTTNAT